jgi:hypothetical protein
MSLQEMATAKPKKSKKVVEEPECCGVCMENYTPIIRKKCVCKYCKADTCSKCIERYLLDRHEDAHCLHCRVNYNDNTLGEICTKTYLQHVYFKHRQEVLINRERANLPGLQDAAIAEKRRRDSEEKWRIMNIEIGKLLAARDEIMAGYNKLYIVYAGQIITNPPESKKTRVKLDEILAQSEALRVKIADMRDVAMRTRWAGAGVASEDIAAAALKKEEEKKKFIRRCTRDNCQGFLSTAWKCGICEYYSCAKCFKTKTKERDDPHECTKEDLETAKLILEDCKPCPNCGEFIMKSSGCSQMWCISCQTPWDWNTGKVVTAGAIHNPHYYEWMRRNGQAMDRNPLDVPCGGYPNAWELRRMPHGITAAASNNFFEFHRICQELQDISGRTYRSHIDQTTTTAINTKFLLGDFDEKHWGQMLGKNERKRKRDREVQEVLAAFRMVAVELINRLQNYVSADGKIRRFTDLPVKEAEKFLEGLYKEIDELVVMINDGLRSVSIGFNYSVPYIAKDGVYYSIKTKNFSGEVKKRRPKKETVAAGGGGDDGDDDTVSIDSIETDAAPVVEEPKNEVVVKKTTGKPKVATPAEPAKVTIRRKKPQVAPSGAPEGAEPSLAEELGEDVDLQAAIAASLGK